MLRDGEDRKVTFKKKKVGNGLSENQATDLLGRHLVIAGQY